MFQSQGNVTNDGTVSRTCANSMDPSQQNQQSMNYNGTHGQAVGQQSQNAHDSLMMKGAKIKPYVKITEQPAGKALRFRYECEGRSAGSIPGVHSTPENKTYPTIQIVGYKGRAVVVVSCVTKDPPYRPHPHNLVGKEGCKKGVCTLEINSETMRAVFSNLGIQCVKKKDIESALKAREEIRVDPFKTGFAHRNPNEASKIDLNSVRLCFQVFMESDQKGRFTQPLAPVVSDPIYDKKAMSDLVICRLCSCSASVMGNTQIILLCEKVAKEDITVRFFEEDDNGEVVWEAFGDFQHTDVHKQTAITFKTPRYRNLEITEPAKVFIQLRRPSDGVTSEKLPFEYKPLDSDPGHLRRKRQKTNGDPRHILFQHSNDHNDGRFVSWNAPNIPRIKTEPAELSPQPFAHYGGKQELPPSPQPLSPSNTYNPQSTPSPYNLPAATQNGGNQLLSPNHNAYANGNTNRDNVVSPMDMQGYGVFNQQNNPNHGAHVNAQFQANIFPKVTNATHWGQKNTAYNQNNNNNNQNQTANNMSNLNSTNTFTMHNLLNNNQHVSSSGVNHGSLHWNLSPNIINQHSMESSNIPQDPNNQQQNLYQMGNDHNLPGVVSNENSNNDNGPTISNLLGLDSEQLVRINSEDLRLNSEDLQISNLSIST